MFLFYLEYGQQALPETVKIWSILLFEFLIKSTTKNLHAKKGKYHNKKKK